MQVHTLSYEDLQYNDYHLIGIHSAVEDYRLAYFINVHLKVNLHRSKSDIDLNSRAHEAYFTLYEYIDANNDENWQLVSNVYKTKLKNKTISLFSENETRLFLLPEKKKIDFILKLVGDITIRKIDYINNKINEIPEVITSYKLDINQLKSKEYLIF